MALRKVVLVAAVVGAAGAVLVGVTRAAAVATDPGCAPRWWPQPRQNACSTGSADNPEAPSPGNVSRLERAWTYQAGSREVSQPIVWKGPVMRAPFVYVAAEGRLHALELATGRLRWKAKTAATRDETPVAERDVLLHLGWSALRRFVPRSGHVVWHRKVSLENGIELQVVADGTWYMIQDWMLRARDARTGRERWTRDFDCFHCSVAAAGGRVYVAGDPVVYGEGEIRGALYALDASTGKTIWSGRTAAGYVVGASPVLVDGRMLVRTMAGGEGERRFAVEAFRASDGKHLWHAPVGTAKGFWFTPLAADAELAVYPSEDGNLYALDVSTGKLRWKAPGMTNGVTPAIVNGLVWAGDEEGRLVALDARNGKRLWASTVLNPEADTTGGPSPVLAGPYLLASTSDGRVLAYRVP